MSVLRHAPGARIRLRRPGACGAPAGSGRGRRPGVGGFFVYARQHPRRARRTLAAHARLRPFLQRAARHQQRSFPCHLRRRRTGAFAAAGWVEGGAVTGAFRAQAGGRIDRARPLRFSFDGRSFTGLQGDTLASALLANGVHLMGRSFKYHRPRGVLASGAEEPSALVAVRRDTARYTPNLRATQVELYEGLEAHSQNRWPSLAFDLGAVNDLLAPFIPAGFYYKTFMWPRRAWQLLYEPRIRAAAGLGRSPTEADPHRYASRSAHCDVLIAGAGPAGLAAAAAAAASGARVMLCDEQNEVGGSLRADDPREAPAIEGPPAPQWLKETLAALGSNARVTLVPRTTAFGYFPHNLLGLNERLTDHLADPHPDVPRERQWQVRAREVVLATGAIERPLVFPGNDRPGIMLAGAARTWLNRYAVLPGTRAVVVTACDEAYAAALELQEAGVFIASIADVRG